MNGGEGTMLSMGSTKCEEISAEGISNIYFPSAFCNSVDVTSFRCYGI